MGKTIINYREDLNTLKVNDSWWQLMIVHDNWWVSLTIIDYRARFDQGLMAIHPGFVTWAVTARTR